MTMSADRNRKLKKVLSAHFGAGKVRVRGSRGTAYGWVTVNFDIVPDNIEHRRELESKVWELIRKNDIGIGTYGYDDPGSDYGYGSTIHINFADPDFSVRDEGTIFLLSANTDAGRGWVYANIPDDAQRWGRNSVVVEHRYIAILVEAVQADGLGER
jgi:hypothetical protein